MTNPLHAAHYADSALQQTVLLEENELIAEATYRARITCPEIASRIVPGQFLMLRLSGYDDPLIGRALAVYDTCCAESGQARGVDVVYAAKGKFTSHLARCPAGTPLVVWGPLGNGFPPIETPHLIMVAGGIGQTPFLAVAQEYLGHKRYGTPPRRLTPAERVTLCYGARSSALFAGVEDFQRAGVDVRLCTDDGSRGHRGLVTDILRQTLDEDSSASRRIVACGPEPMLEAVSRVAADYGTPCQVSLETPMACGIGICFTCVAKVKDAGGDWDYKRTCVEGPVFDAERIAW
jgi:dihydroorotate dehydrogenase electron transfer subunit